MDFIKNRKALFLLFGVSGLLFIYAYFFHFLDFDYSPYYGDENFYFKNSESFEQTLSLKAPFTYNGYGSRIGNIDAHGPSYPIIYGGISLLVGWSNLSIIFINVGLLVMALLTLVLDKKSNREQKLLQAVVVLGSPFVLFYSISFLPELIHVAGAILLFVFVNRYLRVSGKANLLLVMILALGLGFIRSTWFFAFFGLAFIIKPPNSNWKWVSLLLGLSLPFLVQFYLHEQVPNTFSGVVSLTQSGEWGEAWASLYFNIKRNIYFALHFTEGKFYTLQKIWIGLTLICSAIFLQRNKLLVFGIITLVTVMMFNIVVYKNYAWTELRMYIPLCILLNLSLLSCNRKLTYGLIGINLLSFILILPLQQKLIHLRTNQNLNDIPEQTILELKELSKPTLLLDTLLLQNYSLHQLPILTSRGEAIFYILPYYEIEKKAYSHELNVYPDQIRVSKAKILTQ
ncbi:hypothetical protein [Algoriphagus yeomjeoni]|uniref:Dolichyl-phosphate-mannose-protein mannosyltransferase n=1 Tax=Algoriphagus yeomjeoni TaxID=291403 RepID=A0A327P3B0_9BACT|nr:hypothetical protein [Algoriphagus yeomjeoni]RAI85554.1 hypothetical protein LV83_03634 [Algoriphagus yeomjeoni]